MHYTHNLWTSTTWISCATSWTIWCKQNHNLRALIAPNSGTYRSNLVLMHWTKIQRNINLWRGYIQMYACTSPCRDPPCWNRRWNKPSISKALCMVLWGHNAQWTTATPTKVCRWILAHFNPKEEATTATITAVNPPSIQTPTQTKIRVIGKRPPRVTTAVNKDTSSRTAVLSRLSKRATPKVEPMASLRDRVAN